jgi:hypothetical protein
MLYDVKMIRGTDIGICALWSTSAKQSNPSMTGYKGFGGWVVVDVSDLKDGYNPPKKYDEKINEVIAWLTKDWKVAVGGVQDKDIRATAVAMGVLIRHYEMTFGRAKEIVEQYGELRPGHLRALELLFSK